MVEPDAHKFDTKSLHAGQRPDPSTGSRAVKRFVDGSSKTLVYHPSQTRAIPQNNILQQLGMLANSLGGVGKFLRKTSLSFYWELGWGSLGQTSGRCQNFEFCSPLSLPDFEMTCEMGFLS